MSTLGIIITTALLSSVFTLVIFAVCYKVFLAHKIDEKFHTKTEEAADKIEERIKNRMMELISEVSGDLIKDRARNAAKVAKTGAGIFEERVYQLVSKISNAAESRRSPQFRRDTEDPEDPLN